MERLRRSTKTAHAQTEKQMGAKAIFSATYSLQDYQKHLLQLLKMHHAAQLIFTACPELVLNAGLLPEDHRPRLRADLQAIDPAFDNLRGTLKTSEPFNHPAALLGLMYVLKGSEMGGNIIAPKIESHCQRWQIPAPQFYCAVEARTLHRNWKQWSERANALATDTAFVEKAIAGALAAFRLCAQPTDFVQFEGQTL